MAKWNIDDIEITPYPEPKTVGMLVPHIPVGVKVAHKPSGNAVICRHHRAMHRNKADALAVLKAFVEIKMGDV